MRSGSYEYFTSISVWSCNGEKSQALQKDRRALWRKLKNKMWLGAAVLILTGCYWHGVFLISCKSFYLLPITYLFNSLNRSLCLFLKFQHYEGDVSNLELYFVIVNNEYGEQTEEELLPGGKSIRVTSENVITFIHLVANHRLNFQVI